MRRVDGFGLVLGGLGLALSAACAAVVVTSGDSGRMLLGLVPVAVHAWLVHPARVARHGMIGLGLASVVLLVFVAAWAVGGRGWEGVVATVAGLVVADRTLRLVGRLTAGAYR
jgi:hypothetical protein